MVLKDVTNILGSGVRGLCEALLQVNDYQPCWTCRCSLWKGASHCFSETGAGPLWQAAVREKALTMFTRVPASRYLGIPSNIYRFKGKSSVCCFPVAGGGRACSCCDEPERCARAGRTATLLPWESPRPPGVSAPWPGPVSPQPSCIRLLSLLLCCCKTGRAT